jgi:hypothetical protein
LLVVANSASIDRQTIVDVIIKEEGGISFLLSSFLELMEVLDE